MKETTESETYASQNLVFFSPWNATFSTCKNQLSINKFNDETIQFHLVLQIDFDEYNEIIKNNLFNIKTGICIPNSSVNFHQNLPIFIEIAIKPDLLLVLMEHIAELDEVIDYLLSLNQHQPDSSFLLAKNWFLLSAKQKQNISEVGYETLWAKIGLQAFIQAAESGSTEEISEAVTYFFQAWTESNLSHLSDVIQKATSQPFDGFTQFFDELADVAVEAVAKAVTKSDSLREDVITFLKNDNWPFEQIPDQSALRLVYQGQNGQWNCYTNIDETQRTIAFYSICPIATPENRRGAVAEFITRANYGMVIGNFELDYSDGEIRYKTSIDAEGSVLNSALIKQLVYTNVLTMDQYLPGILAVLEEGVEPEVVIGKVE